MSSVTSRFKDSFLCFLQVPGSLGRPLNDANFDQMQQHCCLLFRKAHELQGRIHFFWNRPRELVRTFAFLNSESLFRSIIGEPGKQDCVGLVRAARYRRPSNARPLTITSRTATTDKGRSHGTVGSGAAHSGWTALGIRHGRRAVGDRVNGNC